MEVNKEEKVKVKVTEKENILKNKIGFKRSSTNWQDNISIITKYNKDNKKNKMKLPRICTETQKERDLNSYSIYDLLRYKSQRSNFLIICLIWVVSAVIFYALTIRFKKFSNDIYNNLLIIYTIDFFSCFFFGYLSNTGIFGRIKTIQMLMIISFVGFLLATVVEQENDVIQNVLIIICRICFNSIFCIIYFLSTEIYPTVIRAKGLGYNSAFSRLGGLLAPMIVEDITDEKKWKIFCAINFLCTILTFYLPETVGKPLQEKIPEEDENYIENISE